VLLKNSTQENGIFYVTNIVILIGYSRHGEDYIEIRFIPDDERVVENSGLLP
jgi:hypothetical protein